MEFDFKKKVIIFLLILLAIILFIMAFTINKKSNNMKWPPYVANCPDYWLDLSSNGSSCFNQHSLGNCAIPTTSNQNTVDFTSSIYTGSEGECNKKKWAINCGVTWDGITYGYGKNDPCSDYSWV
jgi:hypothetical protein